MKVDKSVSTTNDSYFSGAQDSIIKFENVFATLVENKILAIKRECEEREAKKKSRTLKGILLKKTNVKSNELAKTSSTSSSSVDGRKKKNRKTFFFRHKSREKCDEEEGTDDVAEGNGLAIVGELVKYEVIDDNATTSKVVNSSEKTQKCALDSQSNNNQKYSYVENKKFKNEQCDNLADSSQQQQQQQTTFNAQKPLSTSSDDISHNTIRKIAELPPPPTKDRSETTLNIEDDDDDDEGSLANDLSSLQQQYSNPNTTEDDKKVVKTVSLKDRSDAAICDDVSSQNTTSDIEFSFVSESIFDVNNSSSCKKSSLITMATAAHSDPIESSRKTAKFVSPPVTKKYKRTDNRKTKSCHTTPIFSRHHQQQQQAHDEEVKKVLTFRNETSKKDQVMPSTSTPTEKVKSQTIVIAPKASTSSTKTTLVNNNEVELDVNDSQLGLVSSVVYHQSTAQASPSTFVAVATPHNSKQQQQALKSAKVSDLDSNEIPPTNIIADSIQLKVKRKRHNHRSSDPVIYPSSGLKHCTTILRPSNQTTELNCDSVLMNDPQMYINHESFDEKIIDLPEELKRKHKQKEHRHHDHERCKERRKRRQRRILVQNLDNKTVKVIDSESDELPQRAKYTIVATACLLLIMCLLLVGITLRMAPLIDDMVRQENERLMQDSINRAKIAANLSETYAMEMSYLKGMSNSTTFAHTQNSNVKP